MLGRTIPIHDIRFRRFADMRYRKQGYEIRVAVPNGDIEAAQAMAIRRNFEEAYMKLYGHTMSGTDIDIVSWRVVAMGPAPNLILPKVKTRGTGDTAIKSQREIYIPDAKKFASVPVYDRYVLISGHQFEGPAIFEERESTVVINGHAHINVDAWGNLVVSLETQV